jgi:hypothetical protein
MRQATLKASVNKRLRDDTLWRWWYYRGTDVRLVLCIIEIPKMLRKNYKRAGDFFRLLLLGTTLAVLKGLDIKVPNPSTLLPGFIRRWPTP